MTDTPLFWKDRTDPSITQVISVDGVAVDLTGTTVTFSMRAVGASTLTVDHAATTFVNSTGSNGAVEYQWQAADVDTAGLFLVWWTVDSTQDVAEALVEFRDHSPATQPAYVELEVFKETAQLSGQTFADRDIQLALLSASRGIEAATGRRFWLDADATSARYYTPDSVRSLEIDDLVTLTSLLIDRGGDGTFEETWTNGTQFVLVPNNAASDYRPYEAVKVRSNYGYPAYLLPCVERSVKVTGRFGWPSVPPDIQSATTIIASRIVKRSREAPFGVVFSAGLDSTAAVRIAQGDPDVLPIIARYSRHRPFV